MIRKFKCVCGAEKTYQTDVGGLPKKTKCFICKKEMTEVRSAGSDEIDECALEVGDVFMD